MAKSLAVLAICAFFLSSCIVTYRDFPRDGPQAQSQRDKFSPIFYRVTPSLYRSQARARWVGGNPPLPAELPSPSEEAYRELQRLFTDSGLFTEAFSADSPPEKGVYCSIDVIHKHPSISAQLFTAISYIFTVFVPSYSGQSGDLVLYRLYIDGDLKKTYRYQTRMIRLMWIGLLPFVWVNFLTPSYGEALSATGYQFVIDAQRDGYLTEPEKKDISDIELGGTLKMAVKGQP